MTEIQVKICGITNFDDARVALEAGADYLGFILYSKSPRYTPPEKVKQIRVDIGHWASERSTSLPNTQYPIPILPRFVGVFVNETAEYISEILTFTSLDYAQIHGDESPDFLRQLAGKAYKAVRPADAEGARTEASRFAPLGLADGPQLMIDAYDPAEYGGTGKKADWHVGAELAARYPRMMLAGGLTPANVAQAIHTVQPWAVDVSSGVEAAPGHKDHNAVRAFIRAAKESEQ